MTTLTQHADQIRAIDVGSPKVVQIDYTTDNLIVTDGERGFAITHRCLEDWPFEKVETAVKEAFEDLRAGLVVDRNGVRFYSREEMAKQGLSGCQFDRDAPKVYQ